MRSLLSLAIIFNVLFSMNIYADEVKFKIGENNTDEAIANLKTLTGLPIKEIEHRARPCAYTDWHSCSTEGFLGKDESFIERLSIDNQFVHSKGLTHQELAEPLLIMAELRPENCVVKDKEHMSNGVCKFNGMDFSVSINYFFGFQESIFNDSLMSNSGVVVTNSTTGEVLEYDRGILPKYIKLYGFYEGNTPYRVSPESIIVFFGLKEKS